MVFSSLISNDYSVISVSESFLDGEIHGDYASATPSIESAIVALHEQAKNGTLVKLSAKDCLDSYAQLIQDKYRNVLLVAEDKNISGRKDNTFYNGSDIYGWAKFSASYAMDPSTVQKTYEWICTDIPENWLSGCTSLSSKFKDDPQSWTVHRIPVQYCMAEQPAQICQLQYIEKIAIIVIAMNVIKAMVIFYTAFGIKENPLMNMGDAVASFIRSPDPTTKNMCLLTMAEVKQRKRKVLPAGPKQWDGNVHRWRDVTSTRRYTTTMAM